MVQFAGLTIEPGIEQHRIEMTKEIEHAAALVACLESDQRVNEPDSCRMGQQQQRPMRHGRTMQTKDDQAHQGEVTLGGAVDESVVLHAWVID